MRAAGEALQAFLDKYRAEQSARAAQGNTNTSGLPENLGGKGGQATYPNGTRLVVVGTTGYINGFQLPAHIGTGNCDSLAIDLDHWLAGRQIIWEFLEQLPDGSTAGAALLWDYCGNNPEACGPELLALLPKFNVPLFTGPIPSSTSSSPTCTASSSTTTMASPKTSATSSAARATSATSPAPASARSTTSSPATDNSFGTEDSKGVYLVTADDIGRLREQLTRQLGPPHRASTGKGSYEVWWAGDGKKNVTWRDYSESGGSGDQTVDFNNFDPGDKLDALKRWHIKK